MSDLISHRADSMFCSSMPDVEGVSVEEGVGVGTLLALLAMSSAEAEITLDAVLSSSFVFSAVFLIKFAESSFEVAMSLSNLIVFCNSWI